ncbi:MAG TPA: hydrogenase maturation protease [Candidatus Limnocylindrales bacterium]|nr:hydrogenase maturation protease [Candidatus Limnocylindrales bacterium]
MTGGVLVVGYGSLLRTDDGVGRIAANRLVTDSRLDGATVIACHQLTPELALDLSRAEFAVLIDASRDQAAGEFSIQPLAPVPGSSSGSHHVDAAELVALAGTLYGRAPEVVTVSVGAASFELGEQLSPVVEAALPAIVEAVVELVTPRLEAAGGTSIGMARGA